MDLQLRGKSAIVTGASQGIGREIARALHAEGVHVALVAHHVGRLESAARYVAAAGTGQASVYTVRADLGVASEVDRAVRDCVASLGMVNYLVNNAGRSYTSNFFETPDEDIDEAIRVKVMGYVRMVRQIVPHMREHGGGHIVNIVGTTARTPAQDFIAGSMANAALVNFTRGISRELARDNVLINAVSPGWTLTERQLRSFELEANARKQSVDDVILRQARAIPVGKLVNTDEVARLTLMLLSPLFPSLTGEEILLDGGATASI